MTGDVDLKADANAPAIGKMQMDILVMALACDMTRVGSIQWDNSVGGMTFPHLGITDGHHHFSHFPDTDADAVEKLVRINTWYAEQFAYLLGKMRDVKEGDGTLLDNTCVIWVNELARGNYHDRLNMPFLLAGSAGNHFRTGRFLKRDDSPHNDLYVSLANAYGIETNTFGDPRFCTGPLSGLT
ncbi:MAG: DUF1552 domain-containing protein, partial [Myxococcales bacterium]|nr:DUF1552 domain-containing protein [Myxococcales bacterium]